MNENIIIRLATEADAENLLEIYAPYVTQTAITFEYEVPSVKAFQDRIRKTLKRYPYLVAEANGQLLGYAYASAFKERAAYDWSVETSIYVKMGEHRLGIGTRLYTVLEDLLKKQHIINVNACIAYPHPESERFHEKFGYKTVAHFTKCGYKRGHWHDMIWMEKMLDEHPMEPKKVIPMEQLMSGWKG